MNECVITRFNDKESSDTILYKNRDRAYKPNLEIVRELVNDIEMVYIRDIDTDWSEGINSFGIGIVSSALSVGFDEKEKKIIKTTGKKSHDGSIIRKALQNKDLKSTAKTVITQDGGVRGHTFISTTDKYIILESTSAHKAKFKADKNKECIVRTNHGYYHIDAGYTSGKSYLSSKIRKELSLQFIKKIKNYLELPRMMRKQLNKDSQLNPVRLSGKLFTTSQIMMNLDKLELHLYLIDKNINSYKGIREINIPEGYTPKIKISVKSVK